MIEKIRQVKWNQIWRIISIVLLVVLLVSTIFVYFMIKTESHHALREAKNITMYFDLLSVEYYGKGMNVYSAASSDGLSSGVAERLEMLAGEPVDVKITSFNQVDRKVKGFTYENGKYRVIYRLDKDGKESYVIDRMLHVATYEY